MAGVVIPLALLLGVSVFALAEAAAAVAGRLPAIIPALKEHRS